MPEPLPEPLQRDPPPPNSDDGVHVQLTHAPVDVGGLMALVKRNDAGAVVTFIGTTRDNFNGRPVARLSYSAYPPLALQTLASIARAVKDKHALSAVAIAHRLGDVPVGDASVLIAVSSPHRRAAWRAGEEALEEVKRRAEIWKYEVFADGGGAWKANCEDAGTHGA